MLSGIEVNLMKLYAAWHYCTVCGVAWHADAACNTDVENTSAGAGEGQRAL